MLLNENVRTEYNRETLEGSQMIMEALMHELILEMHEMDDNELITEGDIYSLIGEGLLPSRNKTIVKLSKQARRNHMIQKSTIVLAKEANDPMYKKLIKALKIRRKATDYIYKKYYSKAVARVRRTISNANKSKPGIFKKINVDKLKPTSVYKSVDAPKK